MRCLCFYAFIVQVFKGTKSLYGTSLPKVRFVQRIEEIKLKASNSGFCFEFEHENCLLTVHVKYPSTVGIEDELRRFPRLPWQNIPRLKRDVATHKHYTNRPSRTNTLTKSIQNLCKTNQTKIPNIFFSNHRNHNPQKRL